MPDITISPATTGLSDAIQGGTWSGDFNNHTIQIKVSATGTPDHFTWSLDGGSASSPIAMVATPSSSALVDGLTIGFTATTGHTLGAVWIIDVYNPGSIISQSHRATGHGAINRSVQDRLKDYVSVMDYGGVADGVTGNAAAMEKAYSQASNPAKLCVATVLFPSGQFYLERTPNCSGNYMSFKGAGVSSTTIILAPGIYMVDDSVQWITFSFRGFRTFGGAGIIRNTYTGAFSNASKYDIVNFQFIGFTKAAISIESSDEPMWEIANGAMYGDATVDTTMGIALAGDVSATLINHVTIQNCAVGIKFSGGGAGFGGGRATLRDVNITWTTASVGRPRAGLWLVPGSSPYSGGGLVITGWSGGNEYIESGDVRVLIADEGSGTYVGDRFWVTTASTGYIGGVSISGNFAGAGNYPTPVVYSYSPNVYWCNFGPFEFTGAAPNWILQFDAAVPIVNNAGILGNIFGPFLSTFDPTAAFQYFGVCNRPGFGETIDPSNEFVMQDYHQKFWGRNASVVAPLNTWSLTAFASSGSASLTAATDAVGGSQAIEVTFASAASGGVLAGSTVTPAIGIPLFLEFDLKAGSSSSLATITAILQTNLGIVMARLVTVPATGDGWRTYQMQWTPKTNASITAIGPLFVNTNGLGLLPVAGKVQIGRLRMYQAWEPMSGGHLLGRTVFGSSISADPVQAYIDGDTGEAGFVSLTGTGTRPVAADTNGKLVIGSGLGLPLTTLGDLLYEDATPAPARLAGNITTTKKFLQQIGTGTVSAAPTLDVIAAADVPAAIHGITAQNTTSGHVLDTVYQNTGGTTMDVAVSAFCNTINGVLTAYSNSSNPPTTIVAQGQMTPAPNTVEITFKVLPGNYYKVAQTNMTLLYWTEYS